MAKRLLEEEVLSAMPVSCYRHMKNTVPDTTRSVSVWPGDQGNERTCTDSVLPVRED